MRKTVTTPKIVDSLAERDGGKFCHYCGIPVDFPTVKLEGYIQGSDLVVRWETRYTMESGKRYVNVDHVIPRCRGGSNDLSNLVLACDKCNQRKGAMPYDDFVKKVALAKG